MRKDIDNDLFDKLIYEIFKKWLFDFYGEVKSIK